MRGMGERLIRLAPSAAQKERRLREHRGDAFDRDPVLRRAVTARSSRTPPAGS